MPKRLRRMPKPPPLFHDLGAPPEPSAALSALYRAFSDYRPAVGYCPMCFSDADAQVLRTVGPIGRADYQTIAAVLHEHPHCSGGIDALRHWLPRLIECGTFDGDVYPNTLAQIFRCGLWLWPEEEQRAIREVIWAAAHGWFTTGHPAPLHPMADRWMTPARRSKRLIEGLLLCRYDPHQVFSWLLDINQPRAIEGLLACLTSLDPVEDIVYYVLPLPGEAMKIAYGRAARAMARISRHRLFEHVTSERLLQLWMAHDKTDPALAKALEQGELDLGIFAYEAYLVDLDGEQAALAAVVQAAV